MEDPDYEWLNAIIIPCKSCDEKLHVMDQSPFDSSGYYYCDSCRYRVDVGLYDEVFSRIQDAIEAKYYSEGDDYPTEKLEQAVEDRLLPCECGGTFRANAPRRCLECSTIVVEAAPGQVIWPYVSDNEPEEKQDAAEALIAKYTIDEPKWRETGMGKT